MATFNQALQLGTISINAGVRQIPIPILTGKAVYVLGRNGTGKSALVHNIVGQLARSIYIPGSRPSYFDNDSLQLTPATRRQMEGNWLSWDRQPHTRYRPINGTQRNEKAILDLQSAETQFKVDAANEIKLLGASASAIARLQSDQSPFDRVNGLMRQANLPTQVVMSGGEMLAQRQGAPYSIAKMSDGERAALIMAAEVISAPISSIFVIDEPELHLHRSIVVPLIAALLRERPDCAFVISTHELELPSQGTDGLVVLVRGATWSGDFVGWWDVDVVPVLREIPEELRVDLLGSRRKILFVEGTGTSLDQPFYALLFPNASVRPKDTARDVRGAVKALRSLEAIHHARAFGVVDNDTLTSDYVETLEAEGIYALPIATIESLYYAPESLLSVAEQQATTLATDQIGLLTAAKAAALQSLSSGNSIEHLAARVAELKLRNEVVSAIPDRRELVQGESESVSISVSSPYQSELTRLRGYVAAGDLDSIIAKYPVRESPALSALAAGLRFRDKADYERAVLARLSSDSQLRAGLVQRLGPLASQLG